MKTALTEQTLPDLLIVLKSLPENEVAEIEAFSGVPFNIEAVALQLANSNGPRYTIRVAETGEPLVVAGLVQISPCTWRTWFFANPRAWGEFGREVTAHTIKARREIMKSEGHLRIETVTLASRDRKVFEWYEACGMEYESTMSGYGVNGESAVMYVSTVGARGF